MSLRKGKIYRHRDDGGGYFMVMSFTKKTVTISPLFGWYKIRYFTYKRSYWDNAHREYNNKGLPIIVQARYDHEKIRRLNKL